MGEEKMTKFNNFCLRYLAGLEIPKKRQAEVLLVSSTPQTHEHTNINVSLHVGAHIVKKTRWWWLTCTCYG